MATSLKSSRRCSTCASRTATVVKFLLAVLGIGLAGGCSGSDRLAVRGAVELDGKALPSGQITFIPLPGTSSPTAGAPILDGQYSIPTERGLKPGRFRVEITAMQSTSKAIPMLNVATGQMEAVEEFKSIVPERYNRKSELTAEVNANGTNTISFTLESGY